MGSNAKEINKAIGDKIHKLRRLNAMTQSELAERAGISVTFLSEIENGKKSMSVDTLIKLSSVLRVSIDNLVFEEMTLSGLQKSVVECMSVLPLQYNESILAVANELARRFGEVDTEDMEKAEEETDEGEEL